MRQKLHAARAAYSSSEPGQIVVLFALFLIVLLVLAGSAFDYAAIVTDDAKLQNAVDAATLAGADALSRNATLPTATVKAIASATAGKYLLNNGVDLSRDTVTMTFPTSTPVAGSTPGAYVDNMSLEVTRQHPTFFWPLVGINSVTMDNKGSAHAARGLLDVAVVIDTTLSEQISNSIPTIQNAVGDFIDAMNPSLGDPRGPRIALARFQGLDCTTNQSGTPPFAGCKDDFTLLSPGLVADKASLTRTADGTLTGGTCYNSTFACGYKYVSTITDSTKLPNVMHLILDPTKKTSNLATDTFSGNYIFNGPGGRNDNTPGGAGYAKKVLIMMTDGINQGPIGYGSAGGWDSDLRTLANTVRNGPDGVSGTPDDVEIYVINFQCTAGAYPSSSCESALASRGANNHLCPGPLPSPVNTSPVDELLINASSSARTSSGGPTLDSSMIDCSHYFPLLKSGESLPALFRSLAGTISRGALTE